ncbi:MAG: type II secretion system protein [Candidatus Altimarinota bacterium]
MKKNNYGFSLVELLVVITILAIISVVAYQNFGGATDKANTSRKINDVSTIETALQQYKVDKNQYPPADMYDVNKNVWGYNSGTTATPSNTFSVTLNGQEVASVNAGSNGGGIVYGSGISQIGAKGTISQETMGKQYLSKDLYDVELGDTKVTSGGKLIDTGIGRYVYAVYSKSNGAVWGDRNKGGTYFNIAYTLKKEGTDTYITKIVGDYDENSCFDDKNNCPKTLIGSYTGSTLETMYLVDNQEQGKTNSGTNLSGGFGSTVGNQGIPYAINF